MRLEALEIDDHILDKIESKHGVAFADVEEACYSDRRHVRKGREGLYKVFSQLMTAGSFSLSLLTEAQVSGKWSPHVK